MHRTVVKYAFRLGMLVALVLAVGACGGGGGGEEAKARKVPESSLETEAKRLPAGEYVSDEFKPAMSFRLDEGWQTWVEGFGGMAPGEGVELRDWLTLFYAPEGKFVGVIDFIVEPKVYRMVSSYEAKEEPTPQDMVAWLQHNPYLDVEEPEPATVGGEKGVQFDAVPSRVPEEYLACGEPCLPLFQSATDPNLFYALVQTEKVRFVVLNDVEGKTVTIALAGQAIKFDEFLPGAQKVLDTLKWRGA